ncbi:MAG: hypothetical protein R3A47_09655 [Polyangiales bacterium]
MKRLRVDFRESVAVLFLSTLALVPFSLNSTASAENAQGPDCLTVTTSAPYGALAYRHVVTLKNDCDEDLACKVSTNVDPEPVHRVVVKKKTVKDVVTRSNSPAREFQPNVQCE